MFRILKLASPSHVSIKNLQTLSMTTFKTLVRLAGLEPAARGLGNRCSIHLSYRRMSGKALDM